MKKENNLLEKSINIILLLTIIPWILLVILGICPILIIEILDSESILRCIAIRFYIFDVIILLVGLIGCKVYKKFFKK